MAEVAAVDHHTRHTSSIGSMCFPGGPLVEMVPNPNFSFPMQSNMRPQRRSGSGITQRPASVHSDTALPQNATIAHRRAASTLPSFNFNSTDTTGLRERHKTPPHTPDEDTTTTPSRHGHRRGGSEFVGGDSRLGVSNAVSSSPTKPGPVSLPTPSVGRRGHAHRRSAAISNHDIASIIQPISNIQPRLSSSLPNTPLEQPLQSSELSHTATAMSTDPDPFGPTLDSITARPPSRPRVGFSDNVEYIPRPLSTVSSETESSVSTVRGHSVNNSISSMLSTPSPPSSRYQRHSLISALDNEFSVKAGSSIDINQPTETAIDWLRSRPTEGLRRPLSESAAAPSKTTFELPHHPERPQALHKRKHSFSHALGFDRRRSEPSIGLHAGDSCRMSTISLQESTFAATTATDNTDAFETERKSSSKKIKEWAVSKISRGTREVHKALASTSSGGSFTQSESTGSTATPGGLSTPQPVVAETDLDAVLSAHNSASGSQRPSTPSQPRIEVITPTPSHQCSAYSRELESSSPMLDLDAALGPFKTPPIGPQRQRKELHSDRLTKDFYGLGSHYHRRAESAPNLPPFEFGRIGTPSQPSMADVFEEEEEYGDEVVGNEQTSRLSRSESSQEDESGVGVQIVDTSGPQSALPTRTEPEDGLGIYGNWEVERPTTSYGNTGSYFFGQRLDTRGSSIIEETIIESPNETVEIVEAHEEPRASSLTKSSDSSDTPTILPPPGMLTLPDAQKSLMTPDTYQTSAFSSPEISGRKSSFDSHSRLGTSTSSITDNRTMSSYMTGNAPFVSSEDLPSLSSGRSSTTHATSLRRGYNDRDRTPSATSRLVDTAVAAERRQKRASIQSLSQLVSGSFGSRSKGSEESRPYTTTESNETKVSRKKEHRLKRLMFWKSKHHSK